MVYPKRAGAKQKKKKDPTKIKLRRRIRRSPNATAHSLPVQCMCKNSPRLRLEAVCSRLARYRSPIVPSLHYCFFTRP